MASLVLGAAGSALGGALLPGSISLFGASVSGATLGGFAGALAGSAVDAALTGRDVEGPRLEALQIQSSTEGAGMPVVYGTMRVAGQVIWAANFKEHVSEESGGKGGPEVREYSYSLSFAVALGEGEIGGVGRIWADGALMDLSRVTWRLYRGTEDQAPDALISAVEGEAAPAYRGTAYVVFEDLDLSAFGNRIPNLSFEVTRQPPVAADGPPRMEQLVQGVAMIPSSGEFAYATSKVLREAGPGESVAENVNNSRGLPDIVASLDDLQGQLPNCRSVTLVVSWFGTDLRVGECEIRPGVEFDAKVTRPRSWVGGGVARDEAHVVSRIGGRPAYGGTPADWSVVQAIAEMKARGLEVVFYPFILMDVPAGSGLPDPYGRDEQPPYPWRGRITQHPAAGEAGSPDQTAAAGAQVAAFFGDAADGDFDLSGKQPIYAGPEEWSFRRMILHYAHLCAQAGGVDGFMIGSEMVGLTTIRDSADQYPAVDALKALAGEVRAILPGAEISYAADWTEYFGHQSQDGSGDVFYHLDPLWSDANIDFVGIDWYGPLSDWRDGAGHADAALSDTIYRLDYLQGQVEGGEGYDWFYAGAGDRDAQARTVITDGAYGEPHVFRYKDIRNWWSQPHHDRPGGVRAAEATGWAPESKPIRFTEIGCPAADKGSNQPNVFYDPKSSESALPYYSDGSRDDLIQRRYIEAMLDYWAPEHGRNPVSAVYGAPMVALAGAHVWTWDARPYPDFPAREEIWTDGDNWRLGHWLTGRAGRALLADVVRDICGRAGLVEVDVDSLDGLVAGYMLSGPATGRDALSPLMNAYGFDMNDRAEATAFLPASGGGAVALSTDDLVLPDRGSVFEIERAQMSDLPREARVSFIDEGRGYQPGGVSALNRDAENRRAIRLNLSLVLDERQAEDVAQRALSVALGEAETLTLRAPPSRAALEPGDRAIFADRVWRLAGLEGGVAGAAVLKGDAGGVLSRMSGPEPGVIEDPVTSYSPPLVWLIDAPLSDLEDDAAPRIAVRAKPWPGAALVWAGPDDDSLTRRAIADRPAMMGELAWDLWRGPVGRWDEGNRTRIRLYSGMLSSEETLRVLNGANRIAIESPDGEWEILQARNALLVAPGVFEISGLLRGLAGTETAMGAPVTAGARVVVLDPALERLDVSGLSRQAPLSLAAGAPALSPYDEGATLTGAHWTGYALRPLSPAHLRGVRTAEGIEISWTRRTRIGGDDWAAPDVPLGETMEAYAVEIIKDGETALTLNASAPRALLANAQEIALFGGVASALEIRVSQLSGQWGAGAPAARVLYL